MHVLTGADHPLLRAKAKRIPAVTKAVRRLIDQMQDTMQAHGGVGLAAPQVGISLRVCLAIVQGKATPLVNPTIFWRSAETVTLDERCLSLPGVSVAITRPAEVRVRFLDEQGQSRERHLRDFDARVVQHEIDHLNGVLIVDYA